MFQFRAPASPAQSTRGEASEGGQSPPPSYLEWRLPHDRTVAIPLPPSDGARPHAELRVPDRGPGDAGVRGRRPRLGDRHDPGPDRLRRHAPQGRARHPHAPGSCRRPPLRPRHSGHRGSSGQGRRQDLRPQGGAGIPQGLWLGSGQGRGWREPGRGAHEDHLRPHSGPHPWVAVLPRGWAPHLRRHPLHPLLRPHRPARQRPGGDVHLADPAAGRPSRRHGRLSRP